MVGAITCAAAKRMRLNLSGTRSMAEYNDFASLDCKMRVTPLSENRRIDVEISKAPEIRSKISSGARRIRFSAIIPPKECPLPRCARRLWAISLQSQRARHRPHHQWCRISPRREKKEIGRAHV